MKFMLLSVLAAFCLYWIKNFVCRLIIDSDTSIFIDEIIIKHPILLWISGIWLCSLVVAVVSIVRFIILM